jgi:hypothetical protein
VVDGFFGEVAGQLLGIGRCPQLAWSLGRRNAPLAAEANELTAEWLDCIAEIVRAGVADGEFHVADVDVAARRLLTRIDGLGAQKVVRAVPSDEAKHIARAYSASELGVAGSNT